MGPNGTMAACSKSYWRSNQAGLVSKSAAANGSQINSADSRPIVSTSTATGAPQPSGKGGQARVLFSPTGTPRVAQSVSAEGKICINQHAKSTRTPDFARARRAPPPAPLDQLRSLAARARAVATLSRAPLRARA